MDDPAKSMVSETPLNRHAGGGERKRKEQKKKEKEKRSKEEPYISSFEVIFPQGRPLVLTSVSLTQQLSFSSTRSGRTLNAAFQGQNTPSAIATRSSSCFLVCSLARSTLQLMFGVQTFH